MQFTTSQKGYSLVEVLVSISVLLIAIVGPMTIAAQGIKSSAFTLEQNTAFFLAQEGIEVVYALRGTQALAEYNSSLEVSWDWVQDLEPCGAMSVGESCSFGLDYRDNTLGDNYSDGQCTGGGVADCALYRDTNATRSVYSHNSNRGDLSPYTRVITVTRDTATVVTVDVEVTWESRVFAGRTQSVSVSTELQDITEDIS